MHASVPDAYAQFTYEFLTHMLSMFWRALYNFEIFTLMLSITVKNWCIYSATLTSMPIAQCTHKFLMFMLSARFRSLCLVCSLSVHMNSRCVCPVHAWVPDVYAQCTHKFLMCMLSARMSSLCACSTYVSVPYAYSEDTKWVSEVFRKNKKGVCYHPRW